MVDLAPATLWCLALPHSDSTTRHVADCKRELRKLNMQLMFVFVELLSALVDQPDKHARLLTTTNQLLQNMLHLVSQMRPAQVSCNPLESSSPGK